MEYEGERWAFWLGWQWGTFGLVADADKWRNPPVEALGRDA